MTKSSMEESLSALFAERQAAQVESHLSRTMTRRVLQIGMSGEDRPPLALLWPGLNEALPDGGLPRGVIELTACRMLGGATSLALAAVRAGQARASCAWCAWIDPDVTLHGPGVFAAGVDLARMLVVRPARALLPRVALKAVASGAFEVVVLDVHAIPGVSDASCEAVRAPELFVRRLALATEASGTTVLLLTDASRPRTAVWPVALRLELSRPASGDLSLRVAKDRRGRVGFAKTVPFQPVRLATG